MMTSAGLQGKSVAQIAAEQENGVLDTQDFRVPWSGRFEGEQRLALITLRIDGPADGPEREMVRQFGVAATVCGNGLPRDGPLLAVARIGAVSPLDQEVMAGDGY
jgi:hypothetical protein